MFHCRVACISVEVVDLDVAFGWSSNVYVGAASIDNFYCASQNHTMGSFYFSGCMLYFFFSCCFLIVCVLVLAEVLYLLCWQDLSFCVMITHPVSFCRAACCLFAH